MSHIEPSEALDPSSFYSLYLGGLTFDAEPRRLRACYVLLLTGRLGLRPGELQHLHEGWVDWKRGELRIPEREPCACTACVARARHRQRTDDGRPLADVLAEECWSPPTDEGGRTVSFGWSDRLSAVLVSFLSERAYLDQSAEQLQVLVTDTAANATGLDPDTVDLGAVRASAGTFLGDAGFDAPRVAVLLGVDIDVAARFTRQEGGRAWDHLYETLGGSTPSLCGEDPDYPLVCDPEPFDREPFDPTVASERRQHRAVSQRDALTNPRPNETPADVAYEPKDAAIPDHLDPHSGVVEESDPIVSTLGQWVDRRDTARRNGESVDATTPTADERSADAADGDGGATASGSDETASPEAEPEAETSSTDDLQDPSEAVTDPAVANIATTFACASVRSGRPVTGRVLVGQAELVVVVTDDGTVTDYHVVDLDQVSDVAIDHTPSGLDDVFDSTVGIAYQEAGNRQVAVVELPGKKRFDFSARLFDLLLDGLPVVTTHPARKGGRVTDEDPQEQTLYLADQKLEFGESEDDIDFGIRLSDIIHVERGTQTHGSDRLRGLSIRHLRPDGQAITTAVAPRDDDLKLLERYVMRHYRERKQQAQTIDLDDAQKGVLVALYSTGEGMDLSMILNKDSDKLSSLLGELQSAGLVRSGGDGAKLTGMGQMLVSDKVDDVNV